MFEIELWNLRRQLARMDQTTAETQKHMDAIEVLRREENSKIEREIEQQRQRELAHAPAPPTPAPASPFAVIKARTLAGLRGTSAPTAPATPPNPAFAANKAAVFAGLRGGKL
jgi:hypothetical protein